MVIMKTIHKLKSKLYEGTNNGDKKTDEYEKSLYGYETLQFELESININKDYDLS